MYTLRIEHAVPDFDRWKQVFDTVEAAEAMHEKVRGIWAGPGKAVMVSPSARVAERVETRDL
jgi:hypothetical protein